MWNLVIRHCEIHYDRHVHEVPQSSKSVYHSKGISFVRQDTVRRVTWYLTALLPEHIVKHLNGVSFVDQERTDTVCLLGCVMHAVIHVYML